MRVKLNLVAIVALALAVSPIAEAFAQSDAAPAANPPADASAPPAPDAAAAKPKPKPKPRPTVAVTVTNQRTVGLKELDAAATGGPTSKKIVTKLAAGGKRVVRLGKGRDCLYDFHAIYDDGQAADLTSVDICKDKTINLVE